MHRSQPWPCQESSNKQEKRRKHRAGLEGSSGFSASPPELCLNPTKELQDPPNHPEAMELQTEQFKLQQETPSISQASPSRDEHTAAWGMQKPSWRLVWLHQHLHPNPCRSPKPVTRLPCQGSGALFVSHCPCLWPQPVRAWPGQTLQPGRALVHTGAGLEEKPLWVGTAPAQPHFMGTSEQKPRPLHELLHPKVIQRNKKGDLHQVPGGTILEAAVCHLVLDTQLQRLRHIKVQTSQSEASWRR